MATGLPGDADEWAGEDEGIDGAVEANKPLSGWLLNDVLTDLETKPVRLAKKSLRLSGSPDKGSPWCTLFNPRRQLSDDVAAAGRGQLTDVWDTGYEREEAAKTGQMPRNENGGASSPHLSAQRLDGRLLSDNDPSVYYWIRKGNLAVWLILWLTMGKQPDAGLTLSRDAEKSSDGVIPANEGEG